MIKFKTIKTATITCNSCGFSLITEWKTIQHERDALNFHEWHEIRNGVHLCPDCWNEAQSEAEGVE